MNPVSVISHPSQEEKVLACMYWPCFKAEIRDNVIICSSCYSGCSHTYILCTGNSTKEEIKAEGIWTSRCVVPVTCQETKLTKITQLCGWFSGSLV